MNVSHTIYNLHYVCTKARMIIIYVFTPYKLLDTHTSMGDLRVSYKEFLCLILICSMS